jgi:hypothetical protein
MIFNLESCKSLYYWMFKLHVILEVDSNQYLVVTEVVVNIWKVKMGPYIHVMFVITYR